MRKGSYVKWNDIPDSYPQKPFFVKMVNDNGQGPFKILDHQPVKGNGSKLLTFENQQGKRVTINSSWFERTAPPKKTKGRLYIK